MEYDYFWKIIIKCDLNRETNKMLEHSLHCFKAWCLDAANAVE